MSQAERESNEVEERPTEPFMVNPDFDTQDLPDEADRRLEMVRGFLNLLACGLIGEEGFEADLHETAAGSLTLLDEARALEREYSRRLFERDRPRREAAEKRRKQADLARRLEQVAVKTFGKDRKTVRSLAREIAAGHFAERDKAKSGGAEAAPANGNGGAQ